MKQPDSTYEIALLEQFLLFSTIFCFLLLDLHVKQGPDFHNEISEVEITRVDYIYSLTSDFKFQVSITGTGMDCLVL